MNPDNSQDSTGGGQPQINPTPIPATPPVVLPSDIQGAQREAAANVIRSQIDTLYTGGPVQTAPTTPQNPVQPTQAISPLPQADQWQQYHSAWQNYYQQYYAAYYTQQVKNQPEAAQTGHHYFGKAQQPTQEAPKNAQTAEQPVTQEQALYDLRHQLLSKVQESAKKARRSRHFIPILSAGAVILVFAFLQYNTFVMGTVMAYVSPGTLQTQNIVVDPNDSVAVTQDPRLIIPKINVDVPVLYDVGSDYDSQMAAMKNGVAQFSIPGASAHPGEIGNVAIAGHSSNDLLDSGDYKFIFAQLEKLVNGDTIYANYKGIRYTYVVTNVQVVAPTNVAAVQYSGDKPIMTLITCTPLGTSKNRLLVTAEQVTPDPATAQKSAATNSSKATTIPGANSPSVFEKLFGAKG